MNVAGLKLPLALLHCEWWQALKTSGGRVPKQDMFPPTAEAYFMGGQDLFGLRVRVGA
jgi:hypothetical protein